MTIPEEKLLWMYKTMLKIRHFELRASQFFQRDLIWGGMHLYLGEEAIATGSCAAIRKDDPITSTHRGHGHCIAKGADLKKMMAELMGKATGYCKGKGGSMHIADIEARILGANGIVAGGIPVAAGAGLGIKLQGRNQVVICFFSDGATNQGSFHESLNLAAIWKLPVVYICENNQYAISMRMEDSIPIKNIADRATSYGMSGVVVDGNDVLSVYEVTKKAAAQAREGNGPTLIEAKTYRWKGHFEGDPEAYRSKEEVAEHKKDDPLKRYEKELIDKGILTEARARELEAEAIKMIDEAEEFALSSPEPEIDSLLEDVYA